LAPASPAVVTSLDNLGVAFGDRGDLDKAENYFTEALAAEEKIAPGSLDCATIQTDLGDVALERHSLAKAEKYFRDALTIREKLAPESLDVAASLHSLGMVAYSRDDLGAAAAYYHRALAIREKLAPQSLDLATTLNALGNIARDQNELINAGEYYHAALAIREKFSPGNTSHAESLANVGLILQRSGQLDEAAKLLEQSLDALENQTGMLGGKEETRYGFRAKYSGFYQAYIDLLMARKQPAAAFAVVERARARSLLELLAEAHIDIRKGVDASLLKQEQDLRHELNTNLNHRAQVLREKHGDEQLAAANQEIEASLAKYQEIEGRVRTSNPNYAALTQPKPLNAGEVQQQLLDAETVLLEYSLGEKHSYVFTVARSSIEGYELPGRAEIEEAARRVYDLLTTRNHKTKDETEQQRQARRAKTEKEYPQAVARLSQMVLPSAAKRLQAKRLLVVSDGALQYVPFTVLLGPPANGSLAGGQPLVMEHEITNLSSATTLAVLRKQFAGRKTAPRDVAVLADPVFDPQDNRLQPGPKDAPTGSARESSSLATAEVAGEAGARKSSREVGISEEGVFPRLPFTRREAEAIYAIAGPERVAKIMDFDANKAMATGPQLKDYRIVHFATHGMLNNEHPDLTGLVFSLVNRQGKMQDGFVRLLDIYNLDLNADLVVLSACQTALGKEVQQEGFVGLTRGFMYAGAARVMATLWSVDDEATAELMKRFYENILTKGQSPAQALRSAQMWMYSQKAWHSPYYWAGFVLQGEWK
jgi:CHAT domain-containing protein